MAAELVGGAFLSAFLQVLFDRLASPTVIGFFKGKKPNSKLLEKLKITMRSVKVLLDDAEEKQITNGDVRTWLDDLKDAFYEADDLLDEIAYAALSSETEAGPQTSIDRFWKFISSQDPLEKEIESKLAEIHEKLQHLVDQKGVLGLKIRERSIEERLSSKKVPTGSLMDAYFYGRKKDEKVILQLLLSDDANCSHLGIIPIVGMGGIGKTTLAQRVYNHSSLEKKQFDLRAWISVSEEFNVSKVTWQILNGFDSTRQDIYSLAHLQDQLQAILKGQKFLLVLDDVWNDKFEHWDILLRPLKAGAEGSKIIITTRLESVASVLKVQSHHLEKLTDEECWCLFSKHAFDGRSSGADTKLEKIGRAIVKKCDGLPLAAKSLGGLLGTKQEPEEWNKVLKSNIWNLRNDNIIPALRLSYLFLPSPLKQCFAYCAIFPKGYRFDKHKLVLLWMGEGFLGQASIERSRMDIGNEYFDELVSRSFFNPDYSSFIMHDLINDLARSVAGEFYSAFDDDDDSYKVPPKTRHLRCALRKNLPANKSEGITAAPLRSFLLNASIYGDKVIYDIIPKLGCLRVLSICELGGIFKLDGSINRLKLDGSINNLKYLRYLDLSYTSMEVLPDLCNLYHLEIFLLKGCHALKELPPSLGNLANLCVLNVKGTHLQKMPPHMGKLIKLQKLSDFVIGKESESSIKELGNLRQLRGGLTIWSLQNVMDIEEASRANIKQQIHLKELELVWKGDVDDPLHATSLLEQLQPHENVETLKIRGYGGTAFPNWIGGGSLVTLKLDGCRHCCQLPPLGQLLHLKQLCIRDFPNILSIGTEFYGRCTSMTKPFQCLEVLRFEKMPLWQDWETCGDEKKVFPLLKELYIIECPAFNWSLPQYLPSLINLEFKESEILVASLPTIPTIHDMILKELKLRDGRLNFNGFPLERIVTLGGCRFFNTLQEVEIYGCHFLKCFPLESFSDLKHLQIWDCSNFETIIGNSKSLISLKIGFCWNFVSFLVVGPTPNLQIVVLQHCRNLKWTSESLPYSLEELSIYHCPKLESFPEGGLPLKLHRLEIDGCTELVNGRNQWNLYCLPSLLYFRIGNYEHAECFPEESLLPSTLTSLEIQSFPNLKSLKGIQHLTSLQSLTVLGCPELRLLPEEGLPSSLTFLGVFSLENLESLVNSNIQQLRNLKKLRIERCPKLKLVPEEGLPSTITSLEISWFSDLEFLNFKGLQNLTSLEELIIRHCPKLQSLPKEGLPISLSTLFIRFCPLLKERYNQEEGEDWPKISHISNIDIR